VKNIAIVRKHEFMNALLTVFITFLILYKKIYEFHMKKIFLIYEFLKF